MTSYARNDDPVSALASLLDALDTDRRIVAAAAKRSEHNRLSMLYVHGIAALIIAPLFLVYSTANGLTSASWTLLRSAPGAPHTVAAWLFVAGIILMIGTAARHLALAAAGLVMLVVWYGSFAATFTYAAWLWWHNGADPSTMPALYAGPVYGHFGVQFLIHLRTVLRMRAAREP